MFKTLANSMMNSVYARVVFAPQNDLGGGGDGGEDFDSIPLSDADSDGLDEEDGLGGDSGTDGDITVDDAQFMKDLFGAGDENNGDEDDSDAETPEQAAEAERNLATQLQNTLANLTLPHDLIPEDFDPSDSKQLLEVLTSVQTHAATNAVKAMMHPVQATLTRMMSTLRREHREGLRNNNDAISEKTFLETTFPGITDPTVAPAIRMAYGAAKKKHPTDRAAAVASTRKALQMLGIDVSRVTNPRTKPTSQGGTAFRSGESALDGFGLSLPRPAQQSPRLGRLRGQ